MEITHYSTPSEILQCFDLMAMLRPKLLSKEAFIVQVQRQQQQGYALLGVTNATMPLALAGYRCMENFIHGRFCYVDDLITHPTVRGQGYAKNLLDSLGKLAFEKGCQRMVLDTGLSNKTAQKFYQQVGYTTTGYHLYRDLY
ncbi:GNAT family N-acetyltransferase [Bartonella sp. HY329]|uniref:GNAT family N-acetyltransferase n=1 Tax=unclassified Bartonella TaxID=2645622 RepID=UPI0021C78F6A|nr:MULTISPECIES: GNAT family N-acetyltransferase [unclassified Bartonella]UXM96163.1 GNAT family N-acetyltransferase [Bartonella sp. HY329]UXN10487.1 GNAT family N-acetyltransferase [Bartonella sp. HY328]